MGWARFDDKRHTNEKLLAAGLAADGLDARAITYSASHETNGHLSEIVVRSLSMSHNWRRLVDTLVRVGRWEPDDTLGGWWIHDYLEYNPSKQELEAKRTTEKERLKQYRRDNPTASYARTHTVRTKSVPVLYEPCTNTPSRPDPYLKEVNFFSRPGEIPRARKPQRNTRCQSRHRHTQHPLQNSDCQWGNC